MALRATRGDGVSKAGDSMTGPLLQANGSVGAPSYAFSAATNTGFYAASVSSVGYSSSGVFIGQFQSNGLGFGSSMSLSWNGDLLISRDAANTLAQRNGTNAQSERLYNTFTDASNGEWLEFSWSGNILTIGNKANGTGVVRQLNLTGTVAADNAAAGTRGEFVTATATSVSMTNTVAGNVASISLTAGDWDVTGNVLVVPAGTTTTSLALAGISTTSATLPAVPLYADSGSSMAAGTNQSLLPPTQRINVSSTTTVYLVANVAFAISTLTASGIISARRVR